MKLRLATVPYLNIEPFLQALCQLHDCEVIRAAPSELSSVWSQEDLDLCLLSVTAMEALQVEPLQGAAISCDGEVGSVLLVARGSPARWRKVALDAASVTSNRLGRVLIAQGWFASPRYDVLDDPAAALRASRVDAALLIGDRALAAPAAPVVIDLGAAWKGLTGLPFVFAAWTRGRRVRHSRADLEAALAAARLLSPGYLEGAARAHSLRTGLSAARLATYLRERISYAFGPREEAGRRAFLQLAANAAPAIAALAPSLPGGCACESS
jgi:predicted solute-binding protein